MRKILIAFALVLLAGCASSPLDLVSGVIGSKPDMTAQVGATNTKQGLGVTASNDASTEIKPEVKDSTVGTLDSSSGKKLSASSISAGIIKADTIQINNSEPDGVNWWVVGFSGLLILSLGCLIGHFARRNKGA